MQCATAYKKPDGIYLHSNSETTTLGLWLSSAPFLRVEPEESLNVKGLAVLAVLKASANGLPHPKEEEWGSFFAPMLKLAGAKSLRAFETNARCCALELEEHEVRIIPHKKLGRKRNYETISSEAVRMPIESSPEEIGAALEEGFRRCVP